MPKNEIVPYPTPPSEYVANVRSLLKVFRYLYHYLRALGVIQSLIVSFKFSLCVFGSLVTMATTSGFGNRFIA